MPKVCPEFLTEHVLQPLQDLLGLRLLEDLRLVVGRVISELSKSTSTIVIPSAWRRFLQLRLAAMVPESGDAVLEGLGSALSRLRTISRSSS